MSQNQNDNLTEDQETALAYRRYLVDQFGPEITIGLATDEPATSQRPSSAQTIVKERDEALAEIAREDRDERLAAAIAHDQDRQAFDRVAAGTGSDRDRVAADRHAQRHGLVPKRSSAERLIAASERARRLP
jgi:hypothetical protein